MVKRLILILFISVFCLTFSYAAEENLTITTYYPSPYGSYNSLQVNMLGVGNNDGLVGLTSGDVPTTTGDVWISGKVGIGTNDPKGKVHIAHDPQAPKSSVLLVQDNNPTQLAFAPSATVKNNATLRVVNGGTDADFAVAEFSSRSSNMVILNNGNVGIGTTEPESPAPNSNSGNLDVNDIYLRSRGNWVSALPIKRSLIRTKREVGHDASNEDELTVRCNSDEVAIGGGGRVRWRDGGDPVHYHVESRPGTKGDYTDLRSWFCSRDEQTTPHSDDNPNLLCYARCLKVQD